MPMPGIFSAIAGSQKEFYSGKRTEEFCKDLPPGVVVYGEHPVQSKPISVDGKPGQYHIRGRFDVVVQFDDKSYGVIDFKTASPSEAKAEMYGRQLQAYAYALENPEDGKLALSPITKLGLLFFTPSRFEQINLSRQSFTGNSVWIEVKRDDENFMSFMKDVLRVLESDTPPASAPDCTWCSWREKMSHLDLAKNNGDSTQKVDENSPPCPLCNGPMTLKNGKFGKFWSCRKYPDCRGTKNAK